MSERLEKVKGIPKKNNNSSLFGGSRRFKSLEDLKFNWVKRKDKSQPLSQDDESPLDEEVLREMSSDERTERRAKSGHEKKSSRNRDRKKNQGDKPKLVWVKKADIDIQAKEQEAPDTTCPICTDADSDMKLDCGHQYHSECVQMQLNAKWSGARITFNFLDCAMCRQRMVHASLKQQIDQFISMKTKIEEMAILKAKEENLVNGLEGQALIEHCWKTLAFYMCVTCAEPYCGGLVSCAADLEIDLKQLRCQKCTFEEMEQRQKEAQKENKDEEQKIPDLRCHTHGYRYAMFKCDSCCNIATWDCIYNHYCERCHSLAGTAKDYPCPGIAKCPLGIPHPLNLPGVHCAKPDPIPFVIGCMKCIGMEEQNDLHGGAPHLF